MIIEQNGGFVSDGDAPKHEPTQPLEFKVTYTAWEKLKGDCDIEEESIIVMAKSYDEAVTNAVALLKKQKIWKQVISIFSVTFICDKWGTWS